MRTVGATSAPDRPPPLSGGLAPISWTRPGERAGMEDTMRERRKRYTPAYKQQAVERVQTSNQGLRAVAAELGIAEQTLAHWVDKAEGHTPTTNLVETPQEELERLRKEN